MKQVSKYHLLAWLPDNTSHFAAAEDQRPPMEDPSEREPRKTTKEPEPKISDHEPRLGPRPRSHNKVLNPPGGKSSIAFY